VSLALTNLAPVFQPLAGRIWAKANALGLDLVLVSTRRDPDEQARLWAIGRTRNPDGTWRLDDDARTEVVTRAPPGSSPHEFGLAMDVVPRVLLTRRGWAPDSALWDTLGRVVRAAGAEWGGDFKGFADRPHIQMPRWRDHK
jgi:hypothetical protein